MVLQRLLPWAGSVFSVLLSAVWKQACCCADLQEIGGVGDEKII
jgi:hypothetical protein